MPTFFTPNLKILPRGQRELWPLLSAVPACFTLYGGTALAIQLGHRESVDFDFFSSQAFDPNQLHQDLDFLHSSSITQSSPNTLSCVVSVAQDHAQVSFFGDLPLARVEDPLLTDDNRIHVASLVDVGGMKLSVIQKRAEAKDYVDIAALLEAGQSLERLLSAGKTIYGRQFNPALAVRALGFFDDLKGDQLSPAAKRTLQRAVRAVRLDSLPLLPRRGTIGEAGLTL
jgi:Nucleotidyl transferase AbiEii toxin, Type IV TA system